MTHTMKRGVSSASLCLLVVLTVLVLPQAAQGAGGLTATFAKTSDWGTGWVANYTIRNGGITTVNGWRLEFDMPSTATVTSAWNGILSKSGTHYTVVNDSSTGTLTPGTSVAFGFQVATSVPLAAPAGCLLNGGSCAGSSGTTTTTKPSTTTTTKPSTTTTTKPSTTTTTTVPPGPGTAASFAPYADVTLWPPVDFTDTKAASGVSNFTMAFIVNGSGTCKASWGGVMPLSDNFMVSEVAQLRSQGGDVIVSFGGASGVELAQSCTTVASLVGQYQAVIDMYGLTKIDFDIEGAAAAQPASIALRSQAIATLQANARAAGRTLTVSLTLPVLPSGLTPDGVNVVQSAINAGANLSVVNVMAMDYGDWAAPNPAGRMGQYAIDSATSTQGQLKSLYPAKTDAQLWRMIGVTPMIGQNDASDEVFALSDAQKLVDFAKLRHVGRLAMWSVARDNQCSGGVTPWADPTCSGVLQAPWAFSKIFAQFTG